MNLMGNNDATRLLAACAALAQRGQPLSRPNPAVGAIIVKNGRVLARGWTQPGGRPHAEAIALQMAGQAAQGATLYVSLEPCAHASDRGPACADLVARSGLAQVIVGMEDPDPRTSGKGVSMIKAAGIGVIVANDQNCAAGLAGFITQKRLGRPHVTLKLATSLDGCIALADGSSRWITGPAARAHCHAIRAKSDAILAGGRTVRADNPRLDVRLPGLETRSPRRLILTRGPAPEGWSALHSPNDISALDEEQYLFIEGGAGAAAAFLAEDLVDQLLLYRAPIVIGGGQQAIGDIGLGDLQDAHGRWRCTDRRQLGDDTAETYQRIRI